MNEANSINDDMNEANAYGMPPNSPTLEQIVSTLQTTERCHRLLNNTAAADIHHLLPALNSEPRAAANSESLSNALQSVAKRRNSTQFLRGTRVLGQSN